MIGYPQNDCGRYLDFLVCVCCSDIYVSTRPGAYVSIVQRSEIAAAPTFIDFLASFRNLLLNTPNLHSNVVVFRFGYLCRLLVWASYPTQGFVF